MLEVRLEDIRAAAKRIRRYISPTLLQDSPELVKRTGAARVSFKREDEQTTGSFKLRGVANKLLTLKPVECAQTVITASSGNHGRAIAYMARQLALSATIVVPRRAPETKKAGIRRYGAELVEIGTTYDHAEEYAAELAKATGSILIHECEDERILAGHGTVGLEMLEENPSIDILLVPAGGGGLLCGAAIAAKALSPNIQVIGVQSFASSPWYYSFRDRQVVEVTYTESLADGLSGGIGPECLELALQGFVDDVILVTEREIAEAMVWLAMADVPHTMIEGSGAVGVAALLAGRVDVKGKNVATILSGRNVDAGKFEAITKFVK